MTQNTRRNYLLHNDTSTFQANNDHRDKLRQSSLCFLDKKDFELFEVVLSHNKMNEDNHKAWGNTTLRKRSSRKIPVDTDLRYPDN